MRTRVFIYLGVFFLLLAVGGGGGRVASSEELGERSFSKEAPIEVTADVLSYDKETRVYHAEGNVVIMQKGTTLNSDAAIVDMASGLATAAGNVILVDEGGNTLKSDALQFNIEEKTAVVARGRLFFKEGNVYITGDPLRKTGPQSYDVLGPIYTTCDCPEGETPPWSVSASSGKVTLGEFLTVRNALFRVKGVPVVYSPYLKVPVNRQRQTGFLRPRAGYSELRGVIMDNALFWAISRNTDATFYLDFQSRRGIGKGVEYRYIRTPKSYGQVYLYHLKEKDIQRVREFRDGADNLSRPESAGDDRAQLKLEHTESLPGGVNFKADINLVSDDEYLLDFGRTASDKSLESLESNVSLSKSWSVYSFVAQLRVFDNLLVEDDDTTLKKLPEVTFSASDQMVRETPFSFSMSSSFINFSREVGVRGQRLDLRPKVSMPLNPGGWFELTPSIAPRATYYIVEDNPGGRYLDRYLWEAGLDLTTTFVRVYRPRGKETLKGLKHTLRPRLVYTYIPDTIQTDLPSFDTVDSIAALNKLTYSLNSTLTGKLLRGEETSYPKYLYMDISQSFDINESKRRLTSATDEQRPLSAISSELILVPTSWSRLTAKGKYDVYDSWFTSYDTDISLSDKRGDNIRFTHRFVRGATRYLEAAGKLRLTSTTDFTYIERFSFNENKSLETSFGLVYRQQCWRANLDYTSRIDEKVVYLSFDLLGLGRVAGLSGRVE